MYKCSKCGSETREGELCVDIPLPPGSDPMGTGLFGMEGVYQPFPPQGYNTEGSEHEVKMEWKEKTGKQKGWIIKSEETRKLKVKGRRCLACGFIEFYVEE
jgi:predicted nucleic-acid-binding Zn-ribbon protein